ncbi:hypothetical protein [Phytohabitans suffuscus]|uniref:Uncharacterized protein n=1 Tax=Phytohabitans suffuscus TaxID=624315 RepID=A0A6F8YP47_9ACTN|nr:hypothetical protein [Phytohabitans suffuscus]BCB87753.1 hypothetical protein Psuf_050660 [Phytohabitans suffuscus]
MAMDGDRWLSATAAERRARTIYRYRTDAEALRAAWRDGAAERGWAPEDWWVPGIDAVTRALVGGRAATPAYAQLGRERAEAGYGIRDALADVRTLYERLASEGPPPPAVRALVQAWAGVRLAPVRVMLCAGFASAEHLRERFAELYRDALPGGLAVVAVEVPEAGSGWEALTLLLEAGTRTPSVFAAEAPMARTSPERVVALVRDDAAAAIRSAIDHVRIAALPADMGAAANLIARLGEGGGSSEGGERGGGSEGQD